ncbi:hypothetical protein GOBAR_AA40449 [Gossypium barbadense]|uniref:Proton pump-interactor 1 n=1 Tax=Gossypium barbadense TaxID=3634 RepID=A0A2P5VN54_GOSBA|nr:hypothetical protein GOBAR_AA40449 [Gossypium barbadense]
MGVEVVDSDLAQLSIDKVTEVDKSFLHENGKLDKDPVYNNPIDVDSHSEEPDKEEENGASDPDFPKDAVVEWPAPKQIHSFHFIRCRFYEDPAIKAKLDQANKEIQKWNKARFKLTDELKAKRAERSQMLSQVRALNVDFEQFKPILYEKKKEIEPLQQALGKLRNDKDVDNRLSLCASEEELDFIIHSLQYRIQHESISLSEEKRILKEIKHLEGTREKLMGVDLNGVRKEQHAVWSKKKQIKDKLDETETKIESLQNELKAVTLKRDKAFDNIQELRKQSDQGEREKRAKKKVAGSKNAVNPEELIEAVAQDSEPEKVDVNTDAPVPATVSMKGKVPKENTSRYRNRTKRTESLPKAILKRKKSMNYWIWAAPAVVVVLVLLALCYYYLA